MKIKCNECGKTFKPGNKPNGLPNGVGFVKDGKVINICYDCICKAGKEAVDRETEWQEK